MDPPLTSSPPPPETSTSTSHSSDAGFPITAIAVIGILATGFLLVSYYVFAIKCCLTWHRIDLLGRLSFSNPRRRPPPGDPAASLHSPPDSAAARRRGLDDSTIRSIPTLRFRRTEAAGICLECAVCLSEFREEERLRGIPGCRHVFHLDCIDVWLQNNANCPLCRSAIRFVLPAAAPPTTHPASASGGDYVVIELGENRNRPENHPHRGPLGEPSSPPRVASPLRLKKKKKKATMLDRVSSMGDECIEEDDGGLCSVQPMRRSFSLDSFHNPRLLESIQEQKNLAAAINGGGCAEGCSSSSRVRRSLFSFGHGR